MEREQVQEIVKETVPIAVEETFLRLGINAKDPLEMQKDMAWVRQARVTSNKIVRKVLLALLSGGAGAGGLLALLNYLN